jgi:hypothetical protein
MKVAARGPPFRTTAVLVLLVALISVCALRYHAGQDALVSATREERTGGNAGTGPIAGVSGAAEPSSTRPTPISTEHAAASSTVASHPFQDVNSAVSAPARTKTAPATGRLNSSGTADSPASAGKDQLADEVPASWGITGSNAEGYTLRTNRAAVLSGSASAVLEAAPDADTSRFGSLVQASSAAAFKGKRIELSGYIAAENALAGASIWLRADDANGTVVAFENSLARGVRGTTEWSYQNIVIDIPQGAVALLYGAILNGRGRLYVDDLQFRVVDASVPPTTRPIAPQPHLAQGATSDPGREPRNLDFEETETRNSAHR